MLRKLWIDEIQMLYNLLRGDIKLVGVRPLSLAKLSLYKKTLREKRMKNKPGLIPPFYADMPESFEELMKSEEKYLESHARHPVRTDIRYASKAICNILFNNARSQKVNQICMADLSPDSRVATLQVWEAENSDEFCIVFQ